MKRILFACFLLTATCAATTQHATAQTTPVVSASDFTAKVNTMDAQLASGDTVAAKATFSGIHQMMIMELGVTKNKIRTAASDADKTADEALMRNQTVIYKSIWALKTNLAANRADLHTKLGQFVATF